jgi:hypothetical protein
MTPRDLLVSLVGRGAKLTARDGRIVIDDPTGVVTEADIADLTRLKPEVLALLAPNPAALADPAPTHGLVTPWPPRDPRLASWGIPWRQRWGRRADALRDEGLDWRSAERQAFDEVLADRRAEGLDEFGSESERAEPGPDDPGPIPQLPPDAQPSRRPHRPISDQYQLSLST